MASQAVQVLKHGRDTQRYTGIWEAPQYKERLEKLGKDTTGVCG